MQIVIEILLWSIIILGTIMCTKAGFVEIIAKPVKFIAALVLAFTLCSAVAESIISPMIQEPITNYISEFMYENCSTITAENATEELPTLLKIAAAIFNIDITEVAASGTDIVENIIESLTVPVISVISVVLAFIAVYVVSKLALTLVIWLINALCSGGLIGAVNRLLGLVFGVVLSVAVAWALAVILELVFHLPAFESSEAIANFEGGFLYTFFNTYNPIELLLSF